MAVTSLQSLSYLTANLAAARNPVYLGLLDPSTFPAAGSGGIPLGGALFAQVKGAVRENPAFRTAYYKVLVADLTASYTVVIDGNSVVYDASVAAPANLAALVAGIAAAINSDGTVGLIVQAAAYDYNGDGSVDSVQIQGLTSADYSFDGSATGTADISLEADAKNGTMTIFGRTSAAVPTVIFGVAPFHARITGWAALYDGATATKVATYTVYNGGLILPHVSVAGLDALWVYASGTKVTGDGAGVNATMTVVAMPCEPESSV